MATATARKPRTRKTAARKTEVKVDAYQEITDRIIELLEAGTVPWHKPWNAESGLPRSVYSHKPYQGINVLILALAAQTRGFDSPWWITANAAFKAGLTFKGETGDPIRRGTQITKWLFLKTTDKVTGEPTTIPILKLHTVHNLDQFDGDLSALKLPALAVEHEHDRIAEADAIISGYATAQNLPIRHGGDRAYYEFVRDYVQLPHLKHFDSAEEYYGAAFHELAHSTGHASRLNRPGIADVPVGHRFGDELYSKEELVAELTSAFLAGHTGIVAATVNNTAAYLQNWINVLKGDKKLIIQASSAATKAANLIRGIEAAEQAPDTAEAA